VSNKKSYKAINTNAKNEANSFIKLTEDKVQISKAVQDGKPLKSIQGVVFIKPF
jgi:hypothetical protein